MKIKQDSFLVSAFKYAEFFFLCSLFVFLNLLVVKAESFNFGSGGDGSVTLSSSVNLNTGSLGSSSDLNGSYADGYALQVKADPATTSINVGSYNPSGIFVSGDKILLINLQGSYTDFADVGNYEVLDVTGTGGSSPNYTVVVSNAPVKSYDGNSFSNQKVIIQRIPQYSNVTVNNGGVITTSSWDALATLPTGNAGFHTGIVAFYVNGILTVNNGGSIDVSSKGYTGGLGQSPSGDVGGTGGEAYCGLGGIGGANGSSGASGGGANIKGTGGNGYCGGGGGSAHDTSDTGYNGGTGSAAGGAGGGGAGNWSGSGGGGGYGTFGYGGKGSGSASNTNCTTVYSLTNGIDGSENSSGNGGLGRNGSSGGGGGGGTYGAADLDKIYFGSAGGSGGSEGGTQGSGGNGGGIIVINSKEVNVSGTVSASGMNGLIGVGNYASGGGGGAGGSIKMVSNNLSLGSSLLNANGGTGGAAPVAHSCGSAGGNGGAGRIAINYATSLSGTASPAAYTEQAASAPVVSANNNSTNWLNSAISVVVSAQGMGGATISTIRYSWGSNELNDTCTSGGNATTNGATLSSPAGGTTLYLCTSDSNGAVSSWSGIYNWEDTKPGIPGALTTTWVGDHYVTTDFTASTSGASDTGGSGLTSYSLCRSNDNSTGCSVFVASGIGTSYTVSGSHLPSDGAYRYYYWYAIDGAGNTSLASSGVMIRMDSTGPASPASLTIGTVAADSVTISWEASNDTGSGLSTPAYYVERANDNSGSAGNWYPLGSTNSTSYTDYNVASETKYYYRVRAKDIAGNYSTYATAVSATTSSVGNTTKVLDNMEYGSDSAASNAYTGESVGSGGSVSQVNGYTVHTFTSSGTFQIAQNANVEVLVVGGGGPGGNARCGGGGGGGGVVYIANYAVNAGSYTVTVGNGGPLEGTGYDSSFGSLVAKGGGRGGIDGANSPVGAGYTGGSGGGARCNSSGAPGGSSNQTATNDGYTNTGFGNTGESSPRYSGGGGGGAGQVGGTSNSGYGGNGYLSSISGEAKYYGGGGGGGYTESSTNLSGGLGGGGYGANSSDLGSTAGVANTGGGGGGGGGSTNGQPGGSGVVIVKVLSTAGFQVGSESSNRVQGSYALKVVAAAGSSLNKSLTNTLAEAKDLSTSNIIKFNIRSSRTGSNIKIAIHDAGGTTTEYTPEISTADVYQLVSWDISGVSTTDKDQIDKIIITVVNADADNTFYIDNLFANQNIGYTINQLDSGLSAAVVENNEWGLDPTINQVSGTKVVGVKKNGTNSRIAEMNVQFNGSNPDFSSVSADAEGNKAFFHTSSLTTITNSASSSYTLYVKKGAGNKVWICPGVDALAKVNLNCSNGYYLAENQTYNGATASVSTESDGVVYWKISGLTGTGGMSVIEGLSDNMSRLAQKVGSDHTLTFGTNYGLAASGQTMTLQFDPVDHAFDLSHISLLDIKLTDETNADRTLAGTAGMNIWGVSIDTVNDVITFTTPAAGSNSGYYDVASQIVIKIGTNAGGTNQIINPDHTGSFSVLITLNNTQGEQGTYTVPIVDSDQINVSGFINTFINFDIDTSVTDTNCDYNTCLQQEFGSPAANYTVDLGELNSTLVNKSNDAAVMHSDGPSGRINSIYFDLTTNAYNGAVLDVASANGGLQGPGTSFIPAVTDGSNILPNEGKYGFQLSVAGTGNGAIIRNSNCDSVTKYCGLTTTQKEIFNTNGRPLDGGRIRMDIAAASSYTNNPGSYSDMLTFYAIPTY